MLLACPERVAELDRRSSKSLRLRVMEVQWEERERARAEILAAAGAAEVSLARGEGRVITRESMYELAEEVKQRGRTRLASEQQLPR